MSAVHTSLVREAHRYTRSKVPWQIGEYREANGTTSKGRRFGWRLFHYLSGGGMRTFGRTVRQEETSARQSRFLVLFAVFALVWLAFLVS